MIIIITSNYYLSVWESELLGCLYMEGGSEWSGWVGGGRCLAVSWSNKYNAALCFIFVTQKIKEARMPSRGWRPVIRPARAVRIISLISDGEE